MTRQYTTKKAGELKCPANYIRQSKGSEEEQRQIGRSFLDRPLHPIITSVALEIYDGNRRHAGVLLVAGPAAEVPVCITDERYSEAAQLEIQMESALHQRGLSPYEQFVGCSKWLQINPSATASDLAAKLHLSAGHLTKVLSLSKCIPAVQEAAAAERLSVSDWYAISKVGEKEQHELLEMKLHGASRDDSVREGSRRKRNGNGETVRLARVKCPLPSGVEVTVAGKELSLSDLIEALSELIKEAKRAADQGLDIRTLAAVAKDKAKLRP